MFSCQFTQYTSICGVIIGLGFRVREGEGGRGGRGRHDVGVVVVVGAVVVVGVVVVRV